MNVDFSWETGGQLVLTCSGRIGWDDRDHLPETIAAMLHAEKKPLILLDIEGVEFVNSAGIGALLQIAKWVRERNGKMVLANTPPALHELFMTVGLSRVIEMADTLSDGRQLLNAPT